MIRVKTCFVAEGVTTDAETKQVSAFGLLESVQAPTFPVALARIALLCMWERAISDPPACGAELLVTLNNEEITRQIVPVNFGQFLRTRSTIRFEGITLAEPGNLVLRLAIPGHAVAEWVITASVAAQAAPGAVGPTRPSHIYESNPVSISLGSVNVQRR